MGGGGWGQVSPHLTFRNNHRQVQIISPEPFSLNCHCEGRGGKQVELKDADLSLSGATAPVTKASQLVCWVCGLLIRCFCMDINRCLLSCCLRQRRSRYSEFAYVDISFFPKRNKKNPTLAPLLETSVADIFQLCWPCVLVLCCSAGAPRGSLLLNAALEILVLSCPG